MRTVGWATATRAKQWKVIRVEIDRGKDGNNPTSSDALPEKKKLICCLKDLGNSSRGQAQSDCGQCWPL